MVPQIDAQNSCSKEGVQVFPIGTWGSLKTVVGRVLDFSPTLAEYQRVICMYFNWRSKFSNTHPCLIPTQNWFSKTQIEAVFKFQIPGKASSFILKNQLLKPGFFFKI